MKVEKWFCDYCGKEILEKDEISLRYGINLSNRRPDERICKSVNGCSDCIQKFFEMFKKVDSEVRYGKRTV